MKTRFSLMVVLALVSALLFGGPANAQLHYKVVDTGKFTPYWVAGDGHSAWGGYQSGVNRQPALFDLRTQMIQPVNQYMDLEAATSKAMYVSSGITRNGRYTYTAFRVDVKSGQLQIVGPDVRFVLAITASEDGSVAGYFSLDNTSNEAPWLQESNGTVHSLPLGSSGIDGNPYAINKQWVAGDIRSLLPSGDSLYQPCWWDRKTRSLNIFPLPGSIAALDGDSDIAGGHIATNPYFGAPWKAALFNLKTGKVWYPDLGGHYAMYSDIIGFYHGLPYGYAQSAISDEPFILIGGYVLWLKPFLKGLEHEPFAHVGTIQPDGTITGQIYHQVDGSFTGYAAFPKL